VTRLTELCIPAPEESLESLSLLQNLTLDFKDRRRWNVRQLLILISAAALVTKLECRSLAMVRLMMLCLQCSFVPFLSNEIPEMDTSKPCTLVAGKKIRRLGTT
jgi:hypothetical protein